MQIPEKYILAYPFFQNYYCRIPNTNFAFLSISKNACTFLKRVAIYNEKNIWLKNRDETHNNIGYLPKKSKYLFTQNDIEKEKKQHPALKIFAVWRDPVERLVSVYKQFILEREYNEYFTWMGFYNRPIPFEEFLTFTKFELSKPDPLFQDEHIRRQIDYYDKDLHADYVVHINSLFDFLDEHNVKYILEKSNQTKSNFSISDVKLIGRIKTLYKDDYKIQINYPQSKTE